MTINLLNTIKKLSYERYMGLIIFGEADSGKTDYMIEFQKRNKDLNIFYIDIQREIINQDLNKNIFDFLDTERFLEWCLQLIPEKELELLNAVVIDNFDFLMPLWNEQKKLEFIGRIKKLEKSRFSKPLLAVLQEEKTFDDVYKKQSNEEMKRIIKFTELEAL